ncbi:MAG: hypothetical protein KBG15_04120 [Kofleriaceae bacterium]|nr:hypothetical protein [Kofleriaceae bacterium]
MNKYLLGSLLVATLSQAVGCVIVDETNRTIGAAWSIKANNQNVACVPGFNTARVIAHPHQRLATDTSGDKIDLFNCEDRSGITAPLPADEYDVWVEIVDQSGAALYAQSVPVYVDLRSTDKDVSFDIHTDKGYFFMNWALSGQASGAALACSQVPTLASISLDTTPATPATLFDCEQQAGYSQAYPAGLYQVAASALNSAQESLGESSTFANKQIKLPNQVTNLGTAMILISGQ